MEPKDLVKVWSAPDHSKLTPKQISLRLPIQVAAKISALCDLYPRKTKTEIIGDLLATALDQLYEGLPSRQGEMLGIGEDGEPEYAEIGLRGEFWQLTQKYLKEFEDDLGGKG